MKHIETDRLSGRQRLQVCEQMAFAAAAKPSISRSKDRVRNTLSDIDGTRRGQVTWPPRERNMFLIFLSAGFFTTVGPGGRDLDLDRSGVGQQL